MCDIGKYLVARRATLVHFQSHTYPGFMLSII